MTTSIFDTDSAARIIREKAYELDFDAVGFALPGAIERISPRLFDFLERGWHGDMTWLADRAEKRSSPVMLWPEVRSVIMLAVNYWDGTEPMEQLVQSNRGAVSIYAQSKDYHDVVKKRLKRLGRWIGEKFDCPLRVFVDTAPVMEKPLAEAAGIGWQGKHTNLVSRDFGSWLFLGAIFTPLKLAASTPHRDRCGSCHACLDICPTDAFPGPYQLDARRCISYLTIEHKGHIPLEFRKPMGNRIFGCDDCLAVCPWNKFARKSRHAALVPRTSLKTPDLVRLSRLDDQAFRSMMAGTAIKRTGRDRFIRNVMIALGNSGERKVLPAVRERLNDSSALVRAMAVWALAQLMESTEFEKTRQRYEPQEIDPAVLEEWRGAATG